MRYIPFGYIPSKFTTYKQGVHIFYVGYVDVIEVALFTILLDMSIDEVFEIVGVFGFDWRNHD